jgi:mutator protein MutT
MKKVGVGALIRNQDGHFLLSLRGPKCRAEQHKWEFPGGEVNPGETPEDAAAREVLEETGLAVQPVRIVESSTIRTGSGEWQYYTILCDHLSGEPRIREPEKCLRLGWFPLAEIFRLDLASWCERDLSAARALAPLGLDLRLAREACGRSAEEVAKHLGIRKAHLCNVETGEEPLREEFVVRYVAALEKAEAEAHQRAQIAIARLKARLREPKSLVEAS